MEWYHYIGIILCYILSGILDGERDTIVYKVGSSWFKGGYWTEGNYMLKRFKNPVILWLLKKPFSFMIDGWHLLKSVSILLLIFPAWYIAWLLSPEAFNPYLITLITYFIIGTAFNYSYHDTIL